MKILVVYNTQMDSKSVSGVMRLYAMEAEYWMAQGHQTDFLLAQASFAQFRKLAPAASRFIASDRLFDATSYLAKTWLYFPAYLWRMFTCHFTRLPERYDLVYATGQFVVEIYSAMMLARRQRAKLAVKVHHVLQFQPGRRGAWDRLFLAAERVSARLINRHADVVICSNGGIAQELRRLDELCGLKPRPVIPIGDGIDLEALRQLPEETKEFDVVFLGRMHLHKGVFDLPKVWQQVVRQRPKARLVVIGEGPHRLESQRLFEELGLSHSALFTGGIGDAEKNRFLKKARLGLSLSYEEGWGLSVTEFLATALPVVAYDLPVFREVFPGCFEMVPLGDIAGAAREILRLLADADLSQRRGRQGQDFVRRYDYRVFAAQELKVLEGVCSSPGVVSPK
jgi:glycosyltransferase involved in cell wall biosynthesis